MENIRLQKNQWTLSLPIHIMQFHLTLDKQLQYNYKSKFC